MAKETEVERLLVRLMGDSTSFIRMLKEAEEAANRTSQKILKDFQTLSLGIGLPLAAVGAMSVKAFADFDHAMTESTSIMDTTIEQTERMKKVALDLSGTTAQAPADLAKAYYFLASAGLSVEQNIAALPAVARFATAGAFDLSTATTMAADAQSALGMRSADANKNLQNMVRVTDVLVKANILANASTQQFSEALTNDAGAAFRMFKIDVEEGVAVLAAMADQGTKGVAAGSELARALRLTSNAARENADVFKRYNIRVFDANGNFRNLADVIEDMTNALGGLSSEAQGAALEQLGFNALAQRAIIPLLGTADAVRVYEKKLREAGGTTKAVAEKQMRSFTNQMKLLRNELTVTAIEIGGSLAPALESVATVTKEVVKWFRALPSEVKTVIVLTAALVVGVLALGAALAVSGAIFNAMFGGVGILLGVIVSAGAAVAAWTYTIGGLTEAWEEVRTSVMRVWVVLRKGVADFLKIIKPITDAFRDAFYGAIAAARPIFKELNTFLQEVWAAIGKDLQDAWEWFEPVRQAVISLLAFLVSAWGNHIITVIRGIGDLVKVVLGFFRYMGTVASNVWKSISGSADINWEKVRDSVRDAILYAEFSLLNLKKISDYVWVGIQLAFMGFAGEFSHFFSATVPGYLNWFLSSWQDIFSTAVNYATKAVENLIGNLSHNFGVLIHNVSQLWSNVLEYIGTNSGTAFNSILQGLADGFVHAFQWLTERGPSLFQAMWMAIHASAGKAIGDTVSDMVRAFTSVPAIAARKMSFEDIWMGIDPKEMERANKLIKAITAPDFVPKTNVKPKVEELTKEIDKNLKEYKWTPLLEGAKNSLKELPTIPARELGEMEKDLLKQFNEMGKALGVSWEEFRAKKLKEFAEGDWQQWEMDNLLPDSVVEDALGEADKLGKGMGKALTAGMSQELKMLDAVLFDSAEARRRIAAYKDLLKVQTAEVQAATPKLPKLPTAPPNSPPDPATGDMPKFPKLEIDIPKGPKLPKLEVEPPKLPRFDPIPPVEFVPPKIEIPKIPPIEVLPPKLPDMPKLPGTKLTDPAVQAANEVAVNTKQMEYKLDNVKESLKVAIASLQSTVAYKTDGVKEVNRSGLLALKLSDIQNSTSVKEAVNGAGTLFAGMKESIGIKLEEQRLIQAASHSTLGGMGVELLVLDGVDRKLEALELMKSDSAKTVKAVEEIARPKRSPEQEQMVETLGSIRDILQEMKNRPGITFGGSGIR